MPTRLATLITQVRQTLAGGSPPLEDLSPVLSTIAWQAAFGGTYWVSPKHFHHAVPIYEMMPTWNGDITSCREFFGAPAKAQYYVLRREELSGAPLALIAVGILAGTLIYDSCSPEGGSSVKDLELKLSLIHI